MRISIPICFSYQNSKMKSNRKEVFLIFANNRIEYHHPDSSILQWKQHEILYLSPKGIKNTILLSQIHKIPELYAKFVRAVQLLNRYSDQECYFSIGEGAESEGDGEGDGMRKMGLKVSEFRWLNPEVEEIKDGYRVKSDCGFAKVVLARDLYIVQVEYLQYMEVKKGYAAKQPNMTKLLLQKYNHPYSQFPTINYEKENPEYLYMVHRKKQTIFNMPDSWKYPLHLIWSSLITHKVIPRQFCYIEYRGQEMTDRTSMPTVKSVFELGSGGDGRASECTLPILGKINHRDACVFMAVDCCEAWFGDGWNIMADGYGFWSYDDLLTYRKVNKIQKDQQFHPRAIPYKLRLRNQPERSLLEQLTLFQSYTTQNKKLQTLNPNPSTHASSTSKQILFDNEDTLINQENVEDVGNFKAFSNGVVICKFVDRAMASLNSKRMEVRLIKSNGETFCVDLGNTDGINYQNNKEYISYAVSFQERTFYPEQWLQKQQYSHSIKQTLKDAQTFRKISSAYLKL